MKNLALLLLILMSVVGCDAGEEPSEPSWRLYQLCVDRAGQEVCLEVKSTSEPTWRQAGWADSQAEPPVPSWFFLYTGRGEETFFKTLGGFNPRVEDIDQTFLPSMPSVPSTTGAATHWVAVFFKVQYSMLHFLRC